MNKSEQSRNEDNKVSEGDSWMDMWKWVAILFIFIAILVSQVVLWG